MEFDLSLLEHVSPIEWDNVVLYGQYILDRKLVRRCRRTKRVGRSVQNYTNLSSTLISPARFQVCDVRQPFLFGRNIGELELRARQAASFKRNQIHCSFLI